LENKWECFYDRRKFQACIKCRSSKVRCVRLENQEACERCREKLIVCELPQESDFFKKKKRSQENTVQSDAKRAEIGDIKSGTECDAPAPADTIEMHGLDDIELQRSVVGNGSLKHLGGTKYGIYLSSFVKRYTLLMPFVVDLSAIQYALHNLPNIKKIMIPSILDRNFKRSEHEAYQLACHDILLAAIGIGACQMRDLCDSFHREIQARMTTKLKICQEQGYCSDEVIMAQNLVILYRLLTTNNSICVDYGKSKVDYCRAYADKMPLMGFRTRSCYICVTYLSMLKENWDEVTNVVKVHLLWILSSQMPLEQRFPLTKHLLFHEVVRVGSFEQMIVEGMLEMCKSWGTEALKAVTVCTLAPFLPLIQRVMACPTYSNDQRIAALREIIEFVGVLMDLVNVPRHTSASLIQFYVTSAEMFIALLMSEAEEARALLHSLCDKMLYDVTLSTIFFNYPKTVHLLHLICVVFSKLEMHDEFAIFKSGFQDVAYHCGFHFASLPECCPISCHGMCDFQDCKAIWKNLQLHEKSIETMDIEESQLLNWVGLNY